MNTTKINEFKLKEDFELLELMLNDSKSQPSHYQPGPYWLSNTKNAINELKRCGIANFRSSANHAGMSYADNQLIDIRNSLNYNAKTRLARWIARSFPIGVLFEMQVANTNAYARQNRMYCQEILNLKGRISDLLIRFNIPYSLLGGCETTVKIAESEYSIHYLNLLDQHDYIASKINFKAAKSIFEIGGGFGANIHILLENYSNIRKILYLDIPPNLYVGTQYLKAFYGSSVIDYRRLKDKTRIEFADDDSLEILCIAPWQIEQFGSPIDVFTNSHSFVEIPVPIVKNYTDKVKQLPGSDQSAVALTSYDGFDLKSTFHPEELPKFFKERNFESFERELLLLANRKNYFFTSPGRLAFQ